MVTTPGVDSMPIFVVNGVDFTSIWHPDAFFCSFYGKNEGQGGKKEKKVGKKEELALAKFEDASYSFHRSALKR